MNGLAPSVGFTPVLLDYQHLQESCLPTLRLDADLGREQSKSCGSLATTLTARNSEPPARSLAATSIRRPSYLESRKALNFHRVWGLDSKLVAMRKRGAVPVGEPGQRKPRPAEEESSRMARWLGEQISSQERFSQCIAQSAFRSARSWLSVFVANACHQRDFGHRIKCNDVSDFLVSYMIFSRRHAELSQR